MTRPFSTRPSLPAPCSRAPLGDRHARLGADGRGNIDAAVGTGETTCHIRRDFWDQRDVDVAVCRDAVRAVDRQFHVRAANAAWIFVDEERDVLTQVAE